MAELQHALLLQRQQPSILRGTSLQSLLSDVHRRDFFKRRAFFLTNLSSRGYNRAFPEILHTMVNDPSQEAIKWKDHGLSFIIQDRDDFVERILPQYLGQATKYTSFTRKLQRWKFIRIPGGPDEGSWFNENFTRETTASGLQKMKPAPRKSKKMSKKSRNKNNTSLSYEANMVSPSSSDGEEGTQHQESPHILPSKKKLTNGSKVVGHKLPLKKRPVDPSLFLDFQETTTTTTRAVGH